MTVRAIRSGNMRASVLITVPIVQVAALQYFEMKLL
jgi:hypothetical protein